MDGASGSAWNALPSRHLHGPSLLCSPSLFSVLFLGVQAQGWSWPLWVLRAALPHTGLAPSRLASLSQVLESLTL